MSVPQGAPPKIEAGTLVAIVGAVDLPCEWRAVGGQQPPDSGRWVFDDCPDGAVWTVLFRVFCGSGLRLGSPIAGQGVLLCEAHFQRIYAPRTPGRAQLICGACRFPVLSASHLLDGWARI